MAHEITDKDKVLSVREYTWHGLETYSDDYLSLEDTRKLVHDWEVVREPVYRKQITVSEGGIMREEFVLVEDQEFNVRTDTDEVLATVPTDRVDVSIDDMYALAETVQGQDKNVLIETAGSLRAGRDVFILLKLDEPIHVANDPQGETVAFGLFQNSYETGAAFRFQGTNVRVVCKNTSRAADLDAEQNGMNLTFAHTKNLSERIEAARGALAAWREDIRQWVQAKEFLGDQRVTIDGVNWFVNQFLPEPKFITDRAMANLQADRLDLIGEIFSPMTAGIELTALSLFEGASSWNEHVRRAQSPQSRFRRAVLSPGTVLQTARDLAVEAVKV